MKAAEPRRARNPLSDLTNIIPNKPTLSSSSAFNKAVTKCSSNNNKNSRTTISTIDLNVSDPNSACYSRKHASHQRKNKRKALHNPHPKLSSIREQGDGVEDLDLREAKQLTVPSRNKRRAASYQRGKSKDAQLQDYIEKQNAYFKEIDEFILSEEEVESLDELD